MNKSFILTLSTIIASICLKAQVPATLLSPEPGSIVNNGELFVVIELNDSLDLKQVKTRVYLSEINISPLAIYQENLLTILMEEEISPGPFDLVIEMRINDSTTLYERFDFFIVDRKTEDAIRYFEETTNHIDHIPKAKFKGRLNLSGKYFETNDRQNLVQQPRETYLLDLSGKVYHHNFKVPLRVRLTNLQRENRQHRNRLMTGLETRHFSLFAGDIHPYYGRHVLPGTRLRGVQLKYKWHSTSIHFSHGEVSRGIDGLSNLYNPLKDYPQPYLNRDSSYYSGGLYRRNITAFHFVFNSIERSQFIVSVSKGTDVTNSIGFGEFAGENLVIGAESKLFTRNDIFTLHGGLSISYTTLDIRKGSAEKAYLDSFVNEVAIYDPAKWNNIMTINNTTVPLSNSGRQSVSFFVNSGLKILQQDIDIDLQRIGAAYYSYAHPYLINDRLILDAGDRFSFFKNKVNGSVNYRFTQNNLADTRERTATTNFYGANLNIKTGRSAPVLFVNYRINIRNTEAIDTVLLSYEDRYDHLNLGLSYHFTGEILDHYISFSYSMIEQNPGKDHFNDFNSRQFNFNLRETFPNDIGINLGYNTYIQNPEDSLDMFVYSTYSLGFDFRLFNKKFKNSIQMFYYRQDTEQGLLPTDHYRFSYHLRSKYRLNDKMSINLDAGSTDFHYRGYLYNDYSSFWLQLGILYLFR